MPSPSRPVEKVLDIQSPIRLTIPMNETQTPTGKTTSRWMRYGYVEAMNDIQNLIDQGADIAQIQEWVSNNG